MAAKKTKKKVDPLDEIMEKYGSDKYGHAKMHRGLANQDEYVRARSTGNPGLDAMTGIGGLPIGKLTECWGPRSSGKSALMMAAAGYMQRTEGIHVWYGDFENATPPDWQRKLGLIPEQTMVCEGLPRNKEGYSAGEVAWDMIYDLVKADYFGMFILDSIAVMKPSARYVKEVSGSFQKGAHAALTTDGIDRLMDVLPTSNAVFVVINQVRMKISMGGGPVWGNPMQTTGGKALAHTLALSLRVARKKGEDSKQRRGHMLGAGVDKNKLAPPFGKCEMFLDYDHGLDYVTPMIRTCVERGIIGVRGRKQILLGQEYPNLEVVKDKLREDEKFFQEVWSAVRATDGNEDDADEVDVGVLGAEAE